MKVLGGVLSGGRESRQVAAALANSIAAEKAITSSPEALSVLGRFRS